MYVLIRSKVQAVSFLAAQVPPQQLDKFLEFHAQLPENNNFPPTGQVTGRLNSRQREHQSSQPRSLLGTMVAPYPAILPVPLYSR